MFLLCTPVRFRCNWVQNLMIKYMEPLILLSFLLQNPKPKSQKKEKRKNPTCHLSYSNASFHWIKCHYTYLACLLVNCVTITPSSSPLLFHAIFYYPIELVLIQNMIESKLQGEKMFTFQYSIFFMSMLLPMSQDNGQFYTPLNLNKL